MGTNYFVLKNLSVTKVYDMGRFALFFTLICLSFQAPAMNPEVWQIEYLQVEDGLPSATVYSMAEDQYGYIWFGTTGGLARYDGHDFKVFRHDGINKKTISNNNAGNIFIDNKNRLWVGTFGGGVNRLNLNTGEMVRFPYSSNQIDNMVSENVQTFHEDGQNNIWIGTATGLYQLNSNDQLTHYGQSLDNGLTHARVWDIVGDDNQLWIGTSGGLTHFNLQSRQFTLYTLPKSMVLDISSNQFRTLLMGPNILWIGSSSGLYSFNLNTKTFEFHNPEHQVIKINHLQSISDERLLIASMEGLFEFNIANNHFSSNNEGELWQPFSHLDIRQATLQANGLLWLATRDNGVVKVDQSGGMFHHHNQQLPLPDQNDKNKPVWSMAQSQNDTLLIGTSDTVLAHVENDSFETIKTNGVNPGIVRDIKATTIGTWVAGSEGLFFIPNGSHEAELINQPFDLVGVEPVEVFSIEITDSGEVWMVLYNLGILKWHPENGTAELIQQYSGGSLTDLNLVHIIADDHQNLWVGSNLVGVFRVRHDNRHMELFSHDFNDENSLSSNRINDIFLDSRNQLWAATERGLNHFDDSTQQFVRTRGAEQLTHLSVQSIVEDSSQLLWLATQFGLAKFDPTNGTLQHFAINQSIKNDGVISRSATINNDGVIFLGSTDGYYTFNPKRLNAQTMTEPELVMTEVSINNRPFSFKETTNLPDTLELSYEDRQLAFEFAALDFQSPEQIRYYYRLVGLHDDWLEVTRNRRVELNQLNPGQYKLELKATNNDGRWQQVNKQLTLIAHPIWWNRPWVKLLLLVGLVLIAWLLHYNRTRNIRRLNQQLESEVASRTAELSELNLQLKAAAHSDFLTGLANRMAFIKGFKTKKKQSNKNTIVLADIDHFKLINDKYGHVVGDEVLKQVGQAMQSLIRDVDLLARWGGEEFIFYFDHMDAENTQKLIERIRKAVESTPIQCEDHSISVTLTFGICQRKPDMTLNDCINAADEAMYVGKSQGRNQVVVVEG